ncbi:MAG: porin family protein [Candidatus Tenebribacter davisii]|nr:porin family protein [Candidatus Tenebribacter davisii]
MKKLILIFLLILCFNLLYSQLINSYGIKAGLSIANQDYDFTYIDGLMTNYRYGMDISPFVEIVINNRFNLLLEIHYIQKGTDVEIDVRDNIGQLIDTEVSIIVNYLEFDLFTKFEIGQSRVKPYIIGGSIIDIFIGYKNEWNFFDSYYDDFNPIDFGISIGLGTEYQLSKKITSLLEIRFSPSLTTSYKVDVIEISNLSFEILTGIKF